MFYESQDPSQAYTRWLAETSQSDRYSAPIRQLLEARGRRQSQLAPLFGYGISRDIGGQGRDFAPFYSRDQGRYPAWQDTQRQLQEAQRALQSGDQATPYQLALSGVYQNPSNQLNALQAGIGARAPAMLRPGVERQLARRFATQQATSPNQRFIDYAAQAGYF